MNLLEQYRNSKDFIVNTNEEYGLHSVKYAHNSIDWSNPIALQARGIVLDDEGNVVAKPYNKFFNLNELKGTKYSVLSDWIYGSKHSVQTKEDGSLAIFFKYKGQILAASSGAVMGEYANLFLNKLKLTLDTEKEKVFNRLMDDNTVICEYVAPTNRIVLNYEEEELILHGIIHTSTGRIYGKEWTESIGSYLGLRVVRTWSNFNKDDLVALQKIEQGTEGYVVKFDNGHALKIKTRDYVEKHRKATIFFGKADTKKKVAMYVESLFDNTFDDILGLCESDVIRNYLLEIKGCYLYYLNNQKIAIQHVNNGLSKERYFKGLSRIERTHALDHLIPMAYDNKHDKFKNFVISSIVGEFADKLGGVSNG